jgi:hypothetical protein
MAGFAPLNGASLTGAFQNNNNKSVEMFEDVIIRFLSFLIYKNELLLLF